MKWKKEVWDHGMKANLLFLLCQKIWAHTEKRRGSQLALDIANFLWNSLLCGLRWYWVYYYFLLNSFLLFFCMYHFMFDVTSIFSNSILCTWWSICDLRVSSNMKWVLFQSFFVRWEMIGMKGKTKSGVCVDLALICANIHENFGCAGWEFQFAMVLS